MKPRTLKHLYDVREAGRHVMQFVAGKSFTEYVDDDLLRSAVERQCQIVGEALTRLRRDDPETLDHLTGVPQIVGFRNVVVHAYDKIDDAKVWAIIERHLPILLEEVEGLMKASGDWPPAEEE